MLKYTITSPRLGIIAGFRFNEDLVSFINASLDWAEDWKVEIFGNSIGTIAMLKEMTQVQLNTALGL